MLRTVSASNGSTNVRPSELVALGLAESRQSYIRGVALSREPPKLQQAQPLLAAWDRDRALLPSCDTRCWRAELRMRHADLLREATACRDSQASVSALYDTAVWYLVWVCGCVVVWVCVWCFGGGMCDAIASKNTCKTFSTKFFDWRIQSKSRVFLAGSWLDPSVGILSRKSSVEKALFQMRKKARFGLQSKKAVFD